VQLTGTPRRARKLFGLPPGQAAQRDFPMDEQTRVEFWDMAAGTFIAVSVVTSLAYLVVSAI